MANIDKNLIKDLTAYFESNGGIVKDYSFDFQNEFVETVKPKDATELSISVMDKNDVPIYFGERIKLPKKKLVTAKYIINKLNKEKIYNSFAPKFEKLLNKTKYKDNVAVYPTTYGIGVHVLFNRRYPELIDTIKEILERNGIEYTNEYSQARWVYRFRLSKAKENVKRMETLC